MLGSKFIKLFSVGMTGTVVAFIFVRESESKYLKKLKNGIIFNQSAFAASVDTNTSLWSSKWDSNWDKRDPRHQINPSKLDKLANEAGGLGNLLKEFTPTATRHLIFIRHGKYNNQFKEEEKRTLTKLGKEQALYTGIRLRELDFNYDLIVESCATRAVETSALIQDQLNNVKVQRTDLIREGFPLPPEQPYMEWEPEVASFVDRPRLEAGFRKYVHRADTSQRENSYEIFVCHEYVINYFVCRALQLPPDALFRMNLHHGSITWISVLPNGRVQLKCLGEAGHMPPEKLTS